MTDEIRAYPAQAEETEKDQSGRSLVLPARIDEMTALRKFLLEEEGMTEREKKKICLVAEEIFVNICSYAYNSEAPGEVWIHTLITDDEFCITFADKGLTYNPLADIRDPENYNPDEQIGGLGKMMSFTIMDRQYYEYRNGFNVLTLVKSLRREQGGTK